MTGAEHGESAQKGVTEAGHGESAQKGVTEAGHGESEQKVPLSDFFGGLCVRSCEGDTSV